MFQSVSTTNWMFLCITPVAQVAERQHLRSASRRRLFVAPRIQLDTYGRRAFAVVVPTVWNALGNDLRDPDLSVASFRRLLKTHLFQLYSAHWAHYRHCAIRRYINRGTWSTAAHKFRKSPAVDKYTLSQSTPPYCDTALPAEHVQAPLGLINNTNNNNNNKHMYKAP